jgi:hypothetical protein
MPRKRDSSDSGAHRTRTAVNPERNLPVLRKIAIIRLKFRVHPGNPGYTETPLYT